MSNKPRLKAVKKHQLPDSVRVSCILSPEEHGEFIQLIPGDTDAHRLLFCIANAARMIRYKAQQAEREANG